MEKKAMFAKQNVFNQLKTYSQLIQLSTENDQLKERLIHLLNQKTATNQQFKTSQANMDQQLLGSFKQMTNLTPKSASTINATPLKGTPYLKNYNQKQILNLSPRANKMSQGLGVKYSPPNSTPRNLQQQLQSHVGQKFEKINSVQNAIKQTSSIRKVSQDESKGRIGQSQQTLLRNSTLYNLKSSSQDFLNNMTTAETVHQRLFEDAQMRRTMKNDTQNSLVKKEFKNGRKESQNGQYYLNVQKKSKLRKKKTDPFLYERLSQPINTNLSTKNSETVLYKMHAEELANQECTFKPHVNPKSEQIIRQKSRTPELKLQNNTSNKENQFLFYRLYEEGQRKKRLQEELVEIRKKQELQNCTFKPLINEGGSKGDIDANGEQKSFYERLYEDSVRNRNNKMKNQIFQQENDKRKYSFQPDRIAKSKDQKFKLDKKETSTQRSERLYKKWAERNAKIEIQRQELDQQQNYQLERMRLQKEMEIKEIRSRFTEIEHSDKLYEDPTEKQRRLWQLEQKIFKENGYSFAPQISETREYYDTVIQQKNTLETKTDKQNDDFTKQKTYSLMPFEKRNELFMQRKQNNLAIIERNISPNFKPQINKRKNSSNSPKEETGHSRLAKLHADQIVYEEKKQLLAVKLSQQELAKYPFKPQLSKANEKYLKGKKLRDSAKEYAEAFGSLIQYEEHEQTEKGIKSETILSQND